MSHLIEFDKTFSVINATFDAQKQSVGSTNDITEVKANLTKNEKLSFWYGFQ